MIGEQTGRAPRFDELKFQGATIHRDGDQWVASLDIRERAARKSRTYGRYVRVAGKPTPGGFAFPRVLGEALWVVYIIHTQIRRSGLKHRRIDRGHPRDRVRR